MSVKSKKVAEKSKKTKENDVRSYVRLRVIYPSIMCHHNILSIINFGLLSTIMAFIVIFMHPYRPYSVLTK